MDSITQNFDVNLTLSLPDNVNLLTLEPWFADLSTTNKFYLIRLEHIFQLGEHSTLSQSATVDMAILCEALGTLVDIRETTLGANVYLYELQGNNVTLDPMDIRTFIVEIQ